VARKHRKRKGRETSGDPKSCIRTNLNQQKPSQNHYTKKGKRAKDTATVGTKEKKTLKKPPKKAANLGN